MLVSHAIRHHLCACFMPRFKYALVPMNGTVYVLVLDAGGAAEMAGHSFEVDY